MVQGPGRQHSRTGKRVRRRLEKGFKCAIPFPRTVKLKPRETVVFSWITFKSRTHRDRVNAKVMKDPRMARMMEKGPMPFDVKRMAYGGFKVLVDIVK
jgi:uncharacterized protein YbaA (DUF1428 family)